MAQAGPTPTTFCPAAHLAAQASRLILTVFDTVGPSGAEDDATDRLETLGELASHVAAESGAGAFYQSLVALGELDSLAFAEPGSREAAKLARRVRRLLNSIAMYLQPPEGHSVAAVLGSYYGRPSERQLLA